MESRDYFACHLPGPPEDMTASQLAQLLDIPSPPSATASPLWLEWAMRAEALFRYRMADAMIKASACPSSTPINPLETR